MIELPEQSDFIGLRYAFWIMQRGIHSHEKTNHPEADRCGHFPCSCCFLYGSAANRNAGCFCRQFLLEIRFRKRRRGKRLYRSLCRRRLQCRPRLRLFIRLRCRKCRRIRLRRAERCGAVQEFFADRQVYLLCGCPERPLSGFRLARQYEPHKHRDRKHVSDHEHDRKRRLPYAPGSDLGRPAEYLRLRR